MAELVDALDSKSSDFGRAGSIPASSTNKPQKRLIMSELQKEARFLFEVMRNDCFCGFQGDDAGNNRGAIESRKVALTT